MPRTRFLHSVLHSFLQSFRSRNSSYDGYWLFGFLVEQTAPIEIDLLAQPPELSPNVIDVASHLAILLFRDQLAKHRIPLSSLASARLRIIRPECTIEPTYFGPKPGYRLQLRAAVVQCSGLRGEAQTSLFAVPHDPGVERQASFNP